MDLVTRCLFATLALTLLVHSVLSAPMLQAGDEMEEDPDMYRVVQSAVEALRERRDVAEPSLLLSRLRRNTAQWYMGSHHFNDYTHGDRAYRRWRSQNRHHHRGNYGGGQIADA